MRNAKDIRKFVLTRLPLSTIKALDDAKVRTGMPKERMIDRAIKNYLSSQRGEGDK